MTALFFSNNDPDFQCVTKQATMVKMLNWERERGRVQVKRKYNPAAAAPPLPIIKNAIYKYFLFFYILLTQIFLKKSDISHTLFLFPSFPTTSCPPPILFQHGPATIILILEIST